MVSFSDFFSKENAWSHSGASGTVVYAQDTGFDDIEKVVCVDENAGYFLFTPIIIRIP